MRPLISSGEGSTFRELVMALVSFVNGTVIPLIFAAALLLFLWGIARYFIFDSEEAKEKGRNLAVYGIIGLAVMSGIWAIVKLFARTLGLI